MRVIDCNTLKVCEIGLFPSMDHAMKIRLLELPLVFGNLGLDVGFIEAWEHDDGCIKSSIDSEAMDFFIPDEPTQRAFQHQWSNTDNLWDGSYFDSPLQALQALVRASPRFRAALEPDKIEA